MSPLRPLVVFLSVAALGCAGVSGLTERLTGAYDLRGDPNEPFEVGATWESTQTMEIIDAKVELTGPGGVVTGKMTRRARKAARIEARTPTSARVTFREDRTEEESSILGETHKEAEDEPLAGQIVLLSRGPDGKFEADLEAVQATAEQRVALDELADDWNAGEEELPNHPVKVGDSWEASPAALASMFSDGKTLRVTGEIFYTFEEIVDYDGERCARLRANVNGVTVTMLSEPENAEINVTLGGTGTMYRSLERHVTVHEELEGPVSLRGAFHPEGTPPGVKVDMVMTGTLNLVHSR